MPNNAATFAAFDAGTLAGLPERRAFADLPWQPHPKFAGVALKHLLTAADTQGQFSYHLVRIDAGCSIGNHVHPEQLETHEVIAGAGLCVNAGVETEYHPGVLSIFPANVPHEVRAGNEGLRLFAKFIPALC